MPSADADELPHGADLPSMCRVAVAMVAPRVGAPLQLGGTTTYWPYNYGGLTTWTYDHGLSPPYVGHYYPPANVFCRSGRAWWNGEPFAHATVVAADQTETSMWGPDRFTRGDLTLVVSPGWHTEAKSGVYGVVHNTKLSRFAVIVGGATIYELDGRPEPNTIVDLPIGRLVLNEQGTRQRSVCLESYAALAHLTVLDGSKVAIGWVSTCA